jgi:hypothetical protein
MERIRMNRKLSIGWGLLAGASLASVAAMGGCELIVDFDRSKIPVGDASDQDTTIPGDGSEEGSTVDAPSEGSLGTSPDGGSDAVTDAPIADGKTGVSMPDAAETGTSETSDTGTPDTGTSDARLDTGTDTGSADAPVDVVTTEDAGPDAGDDAAD